MFCRWVGNEVDYGFSLFPKLLAERIDFPLTTSKHSYEGPEGGGGGGGGGGGYKSHFPAQILPKSQFSAYFLAKSQSQKSQQI